MHEGQPGGERARRNPFPGHSGRQQRPLRDRIGQADLTEPVARGNVEREQLGIDHGGVVEAAADAQPQIVIEQRRRIGQHRIGDAASPPRLEREEIGAGQQVAGAAANRRALTADRRRAIVGDRHIQVIGRGRLDGECQLRFAGGVEALQVGPHGADGRIVGEQAEIALDRGGVDRRCARGRHVGAHPIVAEAALAARAPIECDSGRLAVRRAEPAINELQLQPRAVAERRLLIDHHAGVHIAFADQRLIDELDHIDQHRGRDRRADQAVAVELGAHECGVDPVAPGVEKPEPLPFGGRIAGARRAGRRAGDRHIDIGERDAARVRHRCILRGSGRDRSRERQRPGQPAIPRPHQLQAPLAPPETASPRIVSA